MQMGVNDVNDILIGREGHRSNKLMLSLAAAAIMVVGALMGSVATARGWSPFGNDNKVPVYYAADQPVKEPLNLNTGFSAVAKAVTPAVVTIRTQSRRSATRSQFMDPFREFFGVPDQDDETTPRRRTVPQQPQQPDSQNRGRLQPSGVGSGVLVSPDGYILTNNHVVDGAEKVNVELNDQSSHMAKVIGVDPRSDIAVLKIEGSGLPTVPIGDSSKVEVGDVVLAIGNPLNVGQTVTMGIISAKSRTTGTGGNASYEDFLQTDAAINRGNSGGALVNLRGELIGIPSQILSGGLGGGGNIGIGFAIPSTMARSVMDQLIRTGKVRRGILGVRVTAVDPAVAEQLGYKGVKGALVQDVDQGKPAEKAGIKAGDIITEFQGQRIEDSNQLRNLTSQTPPETTVKLKVWRDGSEREFSARLEELDSSALASAQPDVPSPGSPGSESAMSGVRVDNINPENIRRYRLQDNARGVVVVSVDPESNAADQLRTGDVIEEVARQPVASINEFNSAIGRIGKKSVLLRVRNQAGVRFAVIESEK